MTLHSSTFEYLKPTEAQVAAMATMRSEFARFAVFLDAVIPAGADKTYARRKLRSIGMWANVAITREADGSPRT